MNSESNITIIQNGLNTLDIYIKGIISDESGISLSNEIKLASESGVKNLIIHINSYGGSMKAAYDIVSAFKNTNMHVTSINEGFAISAASVILAASDKSLAYDYSSALIHDPLLNGKTLKETKGKDKSLLTAIKDGILAIYTNKINVSIEKLTQMMSLETSFNAVQQKSIGLVDEIITSFKKPLFTNDMPIIEIYNIINEHNKIENKTINMIENEINEEATLDLIIDTVIENADVETITCPKCVEVITVPEMPEDACKPKKVNNEIITEQVVEPVIEVNNELESMRLELNNLKVENFILTNSLTSKSDIIKNAVSKHGIDVLSTIINFIDFNIENLNKITEVKNELITVINEANIEINNIVDSEPEVVNKLELANEIFSLKGDASKRKEIKNNNPELYNELISIYENSL